MENIRGPWRGYPVRKILFRIASVCHCYVWRTDSSSAYPSCIMHPVIMQPFGAGVGKDEGGGGGEGTYGRVRTPDSRIPFACFAISLHAPHDHPYDIARVYICLTHNPGPYLYTWHCVHVRSEKPFPPRSFSDYEIISRPLRIDAARLGRIPELLLGKCILLIASALDGSITPFVWNNSNYTVFKKLLQVS